MLKRTILGCTLFILLCSTLLASATGISTYLQNKTLDNVFRAQPFTQPTTLCVALTTSAVLPTSTGATIHEAGYTGYTRGVLNPSTSNWSGTGGEVTGVSAGTSSTIKNNLSILIGGEALTGPTSVTGFAILDTCTPGTGNLLFYSTLTTARTIILGDPAPIFRVNSLTVSLQ